MSWKAQVIFILQNISSCFINCGQSDQALQSILDAIILFQELLKKDSRCYNDNLASSFRKRLVDIDGIFIVQPLAWKAEVASGLTDLSILMSRHCQLEEAVQSITHAIRIYEELGDEETWYDNRLANALLVKSNVLVTEFGQLDDALADIQTSVKLRRDLVVERSSSQSLDLVKSLINLSNRLCDLGRHREGIAVLEEAIDCRRTVMADERTEAEENADLARLLLGGCLGNLDTRLSEHNRRHPSETLEHITVAR